MSTIWVQRLADLPALVPYLLGFHPAHAVVVLRLHQGRVSRVAHAALTPSACGPPSGDAADWSALLPTGEVETITLVYGVESARRMTRFAGIVAERGGNRPLLLQILDGRWRTWDVHRGPGRWSRIPVSAAAAEWVLRGVRPLPDRQHVRAEVRHLGRTATAQEAAAYRARVHSARDGRSVDEAPRAWVARMVAGRSWSVDDAVEAAAHVADPRFRDAVLASAASDAEVEGPGLLHGLLSWLRAVPSDLSADAAAITLYVAWHASGGPYATDLAALVATGPSSRLGVLCAAAVGAGMPPPHAARDRHPEATPVDAATWRPELG